MENCDELFGTEFSFGGVHYYKPINGRIMVCINGEFQNITKAEQYTKAEKILEDVAHADRLSKLRELKNRPMKEEKTFKLC